VGALVFGASQAFRNVGARSPAAPSPAPAARDEGPTPVAGAKKPSLFGLPDYPGATEFASMETEVGIGSVTFAAPGAAPDDVIRFYTLALGKEKWDLVWKRNATMRTSPRPEVPPLRGTRLRWGHPEKRRQLTLLAVHNPHRKLTQVVLSWSPMAVEKPNS